MLPDGGAPTSPNTRSGLPVSAGREVRSATDHPSVRTVQYGSASCVERDVRRLDLARTRRVAHVAVECVGVVSRHDPRHSASPVACTNGVSDEVSVSRPPETVPQGLSSSISVSRTQVVGSPLPGRAPLLS